MSPLNKAGHESTLTDGAATREQMAAQLRKVSMSKVNATQASASTRPPAKLIEQLSRQGVAAGSYSYRPLDNLRKIIAGRMTEAVQTVPHYSCTMRIEVNGLYERRTVLNDGAAQKVSINDLLIKAAAIALMECPSVNSGFTDQGIITHNHADVAFAVAMEGGLVTPIVRAADTKPIRKIAEETRELAARGRRKRLRPEEYSGGSFTVSNLGMFGVSSFDAIVNQPQAAILSVGAPEQTYLFDERGPRIGTLMTVTLTSDHRVIDGAMAATWLGILKRTIENPSRWTVET